MTLPRKVTHFTHAESDLFDSFQLSGKVSHPRLVDSRFYETFVTRATTAAKVLSLRETFSNKFSHRKFLRGRVTRRERERWAALSADRFVGCRSTVRWRSP